MKPSSGSGAIAGHGSDAGGHPGHGGAVVQHAPRRCLLPVPLTYRQHANLQLQRSGYAVEGLHAVCRNGLTMAVQVDEPGSDHQPGGFDLPCCIAVHLTHGHDAPVADSDVAEGIQARFRIQQLSVTDDEVEGFGCHGIVHALRMFQKTGAVPGSMPCIVLRKAVGDWMVPIGT